MGELHNEGLRHVFGTNSFPTTRAEIETYEAETLIESGLEDYLTQQLELDSRFSISEYCEVDVTQEIADAMSDANERMGASTSLAFCDIPSSVISMINDVDICDEAKNDLEEIYQSFSLYTGIGLSTYLSNKENAIAIRNYNDLEKAILLSVISVGKSSLDYWGDVNFSNGLSKRNVAKADVVGAMRGAWRGRHTIIICSMLGGRAGGCTAALRYMLVQSIIDSAVYAFIESCEAKIDDGVYPSFPIKKEN